MGRLEAFPRPHTPHRPIAVSPKHRSPASSVATYTLELRFVAVSPRMDYPLRTVRQPHHPRPLATAASSRDTQAGKVLTVYWGDFGGDFSGELSEFEY